MHASFTWNQVQQPATIFEFSHANYDVDSPPLVCYALHSPSTSLHPKTIRYNSEQIKLGSQLWLFGDTRLLTSAALLPYQQYRRFIFPLWPAGIVVGVGCPDTNHWGMTGQKTSKKPKKTVVKQKVFGGFKRFKQRDDQTFWRF